MIASQYLAYMAMILSHPRFDMKPNNVKPDIGRYSTLLERHLSEVAEKCVSQFFESLSNYFRSGGRTGRILAGDQASIHNMEVVPDSGSSYV